MVLFDECIESLERTLEPFPVKRLHAKTYPEADANQLLFSSDTAFELGGGKSEAVSAIAFTTRDMEDEILLYGPDLCEIKGDCSFARIAVVKVRQDITAGNLYNALRKIEYTRYHVSPRGYMMRISASTAREAVRVGRKDLAEGLSFGAVGAQFLKKYRENPNVQAVKLIFVTDPKADFKALDAVSRKSSDILTALDHLLKDVKMDCHTCSLQEVCAEVEGMLEKA